MLEQEFKYYIENQKDLVQKCNGKFLVIRQDNVDGIFDYYEQAIADSQKKYELGTFLIQECKSGEDSYTQTFHTRVVFSCWKMLKYTL